MSLRGDMGLSPSLASPAPAASPVPPPPIDVPTPRTALPKVACPVEAPAPASAQDGLTIRLAADTSDQNEVRFTLTLINRTAEPISVNTFPNPPNLLVEDEGSVVWTSEDISGNPKPGYVDSDEIPPGARMERMFLWRGELCRRGGRTEPGRTASFSGWRFTRPGRAEAGEYTAYGSFATQNGTAPSKRVTFTLG